jgi:hypothetical protein
MVKLTKSAFALLIFAAFGRIVPDVFRRFRRPYDIDGHWAGKTLERAYSDGYLEGFDGQYAEARRPHIRGADDNDSLPRLDVQESADISGLHIPEGAWYEDAFAKACTWVSFHLMPPNLMCHQAAPPRFYDRESIRV